MRSDQLNAMVRRMQQDTTSEFAESARFRLETEFLPNQVQQRGCAEMLRAVFIGLAGASVVGELESWKLLVQAAIGSCHPSAAEKDVMVEVREVLMKHVDRTLARVAVTQRSSEQDFIAVDVLDAMLTFTDSPLTGVVIRALEAFRLRGPEENARVTVILGPA